MKRILLIYLLLIIFIFSKKESNTNNSENNQTNKTGEKVNNYENFYNGIIPNDKIHELNDYILDSVVQQGNIYRWFLLLYSKTCGHCRRARTQISKLFNEYKNNETIRFGEIEIGDNVMSHARFNISGVPYIILVENNTMYELDLYPSYDNLKKFLNTNFNDVKNETKIFPKPVKFYYVAWKMFYQSLQGMVEKINRFLKRKFDFNKTLTPKIFIIIVLSMFIGCCFCCFCCCFKCCIGDDDLDKEIQELNEYYESKGKRKRKKAQQNEETNENEEGEEEEYEEGEEGEYEEGEGEEGEYEEGEEIEDEEGEEIEDEEEKELTEEEKKKLEEEKKEEEERIKKEEEERKKKEEEENKNKKNKKKNKNKNKKKKE